AAPDAPERSGVGRRLHTAQEQPNPAAELGRLAVLLVVATLLQTLIAPNMRVLGANPDFMLIVVASVGLLRGAETGALFGFAGGVLVALALFQPLGIAAFVLVIVGYFAGRYAETADLSLGLAPLVTVFAGTLLAWALYAAAQFLLGRQVPLGFVTTRVLIPALILNTLLAAPVFLGARWWMRGERTPRAFET
ncbi:MAG TPA: rod shape-determining protein MreD, partial [Thermoleophilia bacterium]|nr:rod shape-determining protein MreD [Thermoleophilia bacterium]